MAKRQKNHQVSVAFNYLIKLVKNEEDPDNPTEEGFSPDEFRSVVARLANTAPLDDGDDRVVAAIKRGETLPFNHYEELEEGLHFGDFEGAYYGQRYRNNKLGVIDADSLNLRSFHYLITRLRDGKILVGSTYHGLYGDYDGLRKCLSYVLRGNHRVASRTLKNVESEIGNGRPVSLKLTYRKGGDRPERPALFGSAGVVAVSQADLGEEFERQVNDVAGRARGTVAERKQAIAAIVNQGHLLELDADDIVGCSAVIREEGRNRTVYFIGENSFSTRFPINVDVDQDGLADRVQVTREMVRVMREKIIPLLPR